VRAVLDPNVIISAPLSPRGAPGRLLRYWLEGAFDLTVSPHLLDELRRAHAYPRLRDRISHTETDSLLELLSREGFMTEDPAISPDVTPPDPDDDYLISLAAESRSILVSGDKDLLQLAGQIPVYSPAAFLALVEERTDTS
jgi:uncharacterized protein